MIVVITMFLRTGLTSRVNEITYNEYNDNDHRNRQYPFYPLFHNSSVSRRQWLAAACPLFVLLLVLLFAFPFLPLFSAARYPFTQLCYRLERQADEPHDTFADIR